MYYVINPATGNQLGPAEPSHNQALIAAREWAEELATDIEVHGPDGIELLEFL